MLAQVSADWYEWTCTSDGCTVTARLWCIPGRSRQLGTGDVVHVSWCLSAALHHARH